MKKLILFSIVFTVLACSPSLDQKVEKLVSSKDKWVRGSANKDYTFIYKRNCICRFSGKNIFIEVRRGKIVRSTIDSKNIDPKTLPTIQQLFEFILDNYKEQQWKEDYPFSVKYSDSLGYPTLIKLDKPGFDRNIEISVSNVKLNGK